MNRELLDFYKQEISELREEGAWFSKQFPDVAKRINFNGVESSDPHIERLLESFAFIAARIRKQNDTLLAEAAKILLDCLNSDLSSVIPSVAIVKFNFDALMSASFGHILIPKGEQVFIKKQDENDNIFITVNDALISPLEILSVKYVDGEDFDFQRSHYVNIKLKWVGDPNVDKKCELKFFITGANKYSIWEKMVIASSEGYLYEDGQKLGKTHAIKVIGFDEKETIFQEKSPYVGFRALIEYLVFPEKYLSFKIDILCDFNDTLDIYIPISDSFTDISLQNFLINTVPIVNFYYINSEPIFFNPKTVEQMIMPFSSNLENERVHKILSVLQSESGTGKQNVISNYFDNNKDFINCSDKLYWIQSKKVNSVGIENTYISFVNLNFKNLNISDQDVFYAKLLCSNRNVVKNLGNYAEVVVERALPISDISFVQEPSEEIRLNLKENDLWKLISFLSLNSLSLEQDINVSNLRGIIAFFVGILNLENLKENLQSAIINMHLEEKTVCISRDVWRGFISGFSINLEIDKQNCNSPVLFGAVVEKILSNFVYVDSFVEVNVVCNGRKIKTWNSMLGMIPKI